jgi:uncharacterized protein (TIGR03032 family)
MPLHAVFLAGSDTGPLLASLARSAAVFATAEPLLDRAYAPDEAGTQRAAVQARMGERLRDRDGHPPTSASDGFALAATDGSVAFLAAAFPGARFVVLGPDTYGLPAERVRTVDPDTLLRDPRAVLAALCAWVGVPYDVALLGPLEHAARARAGDAATPYGSGFTPSLPAQLAALGGSLVVSTYQAGKLATLRVAADGGLNTHLRDHDKPMGLAVAPGRIALGTRTGVWDLRDVPEAAPDGEDACFVPRSFHVTGDIAIHELAFAGDELWVVATAFSCLATLDADHSFVPRWTPPFIAAPAPGDRCHLNGMEVVDGAVRYVTALGTSDTPGGWREGKAAGGVLLEVPSGELVAGRLSMPHSPCWHDGALWVLESGRGQLGRVDLASGTVEPVVELPGFTRGLAMVGRTAFVGLSQIRESSTFGDLPITRRLRERVSGVWMVDLDRGVITGLLRFEDLVQEVFDVAWLPGARYPEIAEIGGTVTAGTFALP